MLSRKNRLSRTAFNRFFSLGRRIHSKSFLLVYAPHDSFLVSVVVSKKVAPRAVDRNRIRRRIYDIVRHAAIEDTVRGVFIFITKQPALREELASFREEVRGKMREAIHQ